MKEDLSGHSILSDKKLNLSRAPRRWKAEARKHNHQAAPLSRMAKLPLCKYCTTIICFDTCDEKHNLLCYSAEKSMLRLAMYQKVNSAFSDLENEPSPAVLGLAGGDSSGNNIRIPGRSINTLNLCPPLKISSLPWSLQSMKNES